MPGIGRGALSEGDALRGHRRARPQLPVGAPEYYEPLSDAPAGWRHGGFVAMWGAMVAAFIVPLVTASEAPLL
jgi:hypothetical protein